MPKEIKATIPKKELKEKNLQTKETKAKATPSKKPKKLASKKIEEKKESRKKSKLEKRGKKYQELFLKIEKDIEYEIKEAVRLAKETANTKFDSSVEVHLNLNIDTKNPEHQIRGSVSLPSGLGKEKRVAVVCGEEMIKEAKAAGAEIVGGKELIEEIGKGKIDFEVLVATPNMMGELAKVGKILGPKGLMPNPKDNTVTENIKETISDIKKGRAEYRTDTYGIVHSIIGKVSFDELKLIENLETFLKEIYRVKPQSVKSGYIKSIYLTTTMGPSIKVKK